MSIRLRPPSVGKNMLPRTAMRGNTTLRDIEVLAGAGQVVLRQLAVEEEAVNSLGDAGAAASVGAVGIALPGQQLPGVELFGQSLSPLVGSGGITGGAHHQNRSRTLGVDVLRERIGLGVVTPRGTDDIEAGSASKGGSVSWASSY